MLSLNRFLALRGHAELSHWTQAEIAAAIVIGLAAINVLGTRWGAGVQNLLTFIKVGFLFAVILLPWLTAKADVGAAGGDRAATRRTTRSGAATQFPSSP